MKKFLSFCLIMLCIFTLAGCSLLESDQLNTEDTSNDSNNYTEVAIGETFNFEGVDITINSFEFTSIILNYFDAPTGKFWVVINATIANNSTNTFKTSTLGDSIVYVTDNGDASYNGTFYQFNDFISARDKVLPFESISGMLTYLVPTNIVPGYYYSEEFKDTKFEFRLKKNSIFSSHYFVVKL